MPSIYIGGRIRGKRIYDIIRLSNGWQVIKTEDGKSTRDFKVRTVFRTTPRMNSLTPKHAHFVIDFYGKLCADKEKATRVLEAIIEIWKCPQKPVRDILTEYRPLTKELPGYDLEYILYALNWILEQEDINFTERPKNKQREIDDVLQKQGIALSSNRLGSQLAVSLFCNTAQGLHPVDALRKANLDVLPVKRARGAI